MDMPGSPQERRADAALPSGLHTLLGAWPIGTIHAVSPATSGTVNRTFLVDTASGRYALRSYHHPEPGPILREHAIIAHVRAAGLPSIAPLPLPGGATFLAVEGRYHALFPLAPGRQCDKALLGPGEATAMGECLGRLHRSLASVPSRWATPRSFATDRTVTLVRIAEIEAAIRALPHPDAIDRDALFWLRGQRDWIVRHDMDPDALLAPLDRQVIHGDYQETNLFFDSGRVSAVIDWDQTYLAPRAWELLRAMHYAFLFVPHLCGPFLEAYRAIAPATVDELELTAHAYAQKIGHDLWVHTEYYLHGNARVRRFLRSGGFVSPLDDWHNLRLALCL